MSSKDDTVPDYHVGQVLHVYKNTGRRLKDGEKAYVEGTVTRVGKDLIDIEYPGGGRSQPFRKKTQQANHENRNEYFRTPEQSALREREKAVKDVLASFRIPAGPGCTVPLSKLEAIAALLQQED